MKAYYQEKKYSCGASAIRNCISALNGIVPSEKYVRRIAKTTINGTDEEGIIRAMFKLGYTCEFFSSKNAVSYKNKLLKILKSGKVAIALFESQMHWVAVTGYNNKKITFIDSDFKKIKQEMTVSEFVRISGNTDKFTKTFYYYLIIISNNV